MIILTKDGSHTIQHDNLPVTYHSIHGAIQESMHVFIHAGLEHWLTNHLEKINEPEHLLNHHGEKIDHPTDLNHHDENINQPTHLNHHDEKINQPIRIFEMGFGTGLNALLSLQYAIEKNLIIDYITVEKFPIDASQYFQLNYNEQLNEPGLKDFFIAMHEVSFNQQLNIHPNFRLLKLKGDLEEILKTSSQLDKTFDLIFYDAFAPSAQPELWTEEVFSLLIRLLSPVGFLTTYCSKGVVRRAMQSAGFSIEKIPGPPGKREMVRASRLTE